MIQVLISPGIPKPLVYTHDWVSRCFGSTTIPTVDGQVDFAHYITSGTVFLTLPPFHVSLLIFLPLQNTDGLQIAGVGLGFMLALFHGYVTAYPLPGPPPTTEAFLEAISNTEVDWACVSPVVIDELGKRGDLLETAASRLKYIFYAGGSVPRRSGDAVAQRLPVLTILGSSEAGPISLIHHTDGYNNAEDWVYMHFNPALRSEMRRLHDDFHELVLVRDKDTESFQPVFTLFPAIKEFCTRDLFRPHPTKDGLWMYHSRIDDVIVFLNGEKTNPISFEHLVTGHPEVKAALVLGAQRFEAGLLIELTNDGDLTETEKVAHIDRIWPVIETANEATPRHARVARNMILFVNPTKPMARAGKGTVQRAATLALYAAEIDQLYNQEVVNDIFNNAQPPTQHLKTMIRDAVAEAVPIDDVDLFQLGMDSLGALRLQRALKKMLPDAKISNSTVYNNPTVNSLVNALENGAQNMEMPHTKVETKEIGKAVACAQGDVKKDSVPMEDDNTSTNELAAMLEVFSQRVDADIPQQEHLAPSDSIVGATILLTGTTGAIGSYVLDVLLSSIGVMHVYCLNRTADAQERQLNNNQDRGLATEFPSARVTFLNGDLAMSDLSLSTEDYVKLSETVTHVIHNAWPVNFSLPLSAFTSAITGVVNLIRFTAQSSKGSALQFYSSIASIFNHSDSEVPETINTDLNTPMHGGYGQSKYIAERLVDQACRTLNIKGSIVRIGQVAGAARTASGWNQREWLPSLITTSAFVGVIPDKLPTGYVVDWVPIDHLAEVLVELVLTPTNHGLESGGAAVHHITHPHPVTWESILPVIKTTIDESGIAKQPMQITSYKEWLAVLRSKAIEAEQGSRVDYERFVRKMPGLKLIEFYERAQSREDRGYKLALSMQKTCKLSPRLANLQPLKDGWVAGWVKEWLKAAG